MADVSQVSEQLGVPERLIERSSAARAQAEGVPVEEVLEAWAGGGAIEGAAPPAAPAEAPPEEAEVEEAAPEEEPAPKEEEEEPEPVPAAAAAPPAPLVEAPAPRPRPKGPPPMREPQRWDDHRLVLAAVLSLFALGVLMALVLPVVDSLAVESTTLARMWRNYPAFASGELPEETALAEAGLDPEAVIRGRQVYLAEGCWYCHTQQVRPIVTDAGLGPVTRPGDLVYERPHVLGNRRVGPDLMHVGAREPTNQVAWVVGYLQDPRAERPWSTMPAYGYLPEEDLVALAQYLVSLKGSAPQPEGSEGEQGEGGQTTTTVPGGG